MDHTTGSDRGELFVQQMTDRMAALARTLSDWVQAEARPLQEIEAQVLRVLHDLGNSLLAALLPLAAPTRPSPDVACPCGQTAGYERMRAATVTTVLGRITVERALYACTHCGERQAPLDQQLQVAAGGLSLGLQELLALLGATQDSFVQASEVLARLCLVQVCPNSARAAIRAAAPEAVETFSYQMPTFALKGNLVHFAAFKRHIGFYPAPSGIAAFQEHLSRYKGAKGSVQFPHDQPLPLEHVTEIVRFRVEENLAVAAAKADRRRSTSHRPDTPQD